MASFHLFQSHTDSQVSYPASSVAALVQCGFLPEITANQLTYRLHRLKMRFNLQTHDADELAQELLLELVRSRAHHDLERAPLTRFLKVVLNKTYCQICRRIRKECGKRARTVPLRDVPTTRPPSDIAESQLNIIEQFGEDAGLLFDLARMSPAQAARHNGVHRGTVSRLIGAIRRTHGDLQENLE